MEPKTENRPTIKVVENCQHLNALIIFDDGFSMELDCDCQHCEAMLQSVWTIILSGPDPPLGGSGPFFFYYFFGKTLSSRLSYKGPISTNNFFLFTTWKEIEAIRFLSHSKSALFSKNYFLGKIMSSLWRLVVDQNPERKLIQKLSWHSPEVCCLKTT